MKLFELLTEEVQPHDLYSDYRPGYTEPEEDNTQLKASDMRKTRLTLLQINKLRKMNNVRNFEQKEKLKVIQQQYGPGSEDSGSDDLGF